MTLKELNALIERVTYKENFKIQVLNEFSGDDTRLNVSMYVRDATEPGRFITIYNFAELRSGKLTELTEDDAINLLRHLIKEMELHESDEWLKLDGKHVTSPHPA